jgi:hypothetical protein
MRKGVALEDSNVVSWARLAKYVTFNIFVAKHPTRVDRMQYTDKVVEFGIQSAKCLGTEMVWFGPMRPAAVAVQDSFKALKQLLVRNIKTIGPFKSLRQCRKDTICHILELDNPDPTGLPSITGT